MHVVLSAVDSGDTFRHNFAMSWILPGAGVLTDAISYLEAGHVRATARC